MSIKDLNIYEDGLPCRISALNNYELINLGTIKFKGTSIERYGMNLVVKDSAREITYLTIGNFFNCITEHIEKEH